MFESSRVEPTVGGMSGFFETRPQRIFSSAFAAALISAMSLTGCISPSSAPPIDSQSEEGAAADEAPAGLLDTDFGNLDWVFRPGGNAPETHPIELVDGQAVDGAVSYQLGEVILAELTGDDHIDAAVQITRLDGNAIDEQWYLWVSTEDGPMQVTLPVARMAQCGTATHSVAAVEGGIEIHESRRSIADQNLPCSEPGGDERTRTVSAIQARNTDEWWPVQTEPFYAFGGLCPSTTHLETYENDAILYPVPDLEAGAPFALEDAPAVFEIEAWPVYGESFPGWVLAGVSVGADLGCAWAERP